MGIFYHKIICMYKPGKEDIAVSYDRAPFAAHLDRLEKELKKQAFWKTALFGTVLLERQWPVYERLALGREWGAAREVRKVLDRLWKGIPTGVRIGDSFWMLLEDNPVEPISQPWDPAAALTVRGCLRLMEVFREKDKKAAGELAEGNLKFLAQALSACGEEGNFAHPLFRAELDFQAALCARLCQVPNSEKEAFVSICKGETVDSIMGELWFPDYPDYKPLKRKKKQEAVLRYTSKQYDALLEEKGRTYWDRRQIDIQERERLLEERVWPDWADGTPGRALTASDVVYTYDVLQWEYSTGAKECLLSTGDGVRAKALYGLAAQSCEALLCLIDRGWPTEKRGTDGFGRDLLYPAQCAYLAGDIPLALKLLRRSWTTEYQGPNCQMLREPQTGWLDREEIRVFYALLQENGAEAQTLLDASGERWTEPYRLLLAGDGDGLHKFIVKQIRALRGHYEYQAYRPTVAFFSLVLLKLARQRGVTAEVPHVVELPPALLDDTPADMKQWPLAGQALLKEALSPNGDKLLAELKLRERFQKRG